MYLIKNKNIMVLSDKEALTLALVTTVTAPDDDKCQECLSIAEAIANRLTPAEVEACKIAAEIEIKKNWSN